MSAGPCCPFWAVLLPGWMNSGMNKARVVHWVFFSDKSWNRTCSPADEQPSVRQRDTALQPWGGWWSCPGAPAWELPTPKRSHSGLQSLWVCTRYLSVRKPQTHSFLMYMFLFRDLHLPPSSKDRWVDTASERNNSLWKPCQREKIEEVSQSFSLRGGVENWLQASSWQHTLPSLPKSAPVLRNKNHVCAQFSLGTDSHSEAFKLLTGWCF